VRYSYNESRRLSERHLPFDVEALRRVVASAGGRHQDYICSLRKLAEGGFNRTFEITKRDDLKVIFRLPYPSTLPKQYAVASEVATMDLVRSHGIPVPRIYGYSITADNPVSSEYIIMEKVAGDEIGHSWPSLPTKDRKNVTLDIVTLERILFSIQLPASGSVYYKRGAAASDRHVDFLGREGFCIGPNAALELRFNRRELLDIDRGPCEYSASPGINIFN
jgi:aminoglycoside phosphotransferase (APT) family kinase protein